MGPQNAWLFLWLPLLIHLCLCFLKGVFQPGTPPYFSSSSLKWHLDKVPLPIPPLLQRIVHWPSIYENVDSKIVPSFSPPRKTCASFSFFSRIPGWFLGVCFLPLSLCVIYWATDKATPPPSFITPPLCFERAKYEFDLKRN